MASITATQGKFIVTHTIQNNNITPSFILTTRNTFVDKDIEVKIYTTTATATITGNGAISAINLNNKSFSQSGITPIVVAPVTTTPNSASATYYIALNASVPDTSITYTKSINVAGHLGAINQIATNGKVNGTNTDYYIPLNSAAVTLNGSTTASTPTAQNAGVNGALSVTPSTAKPASGYFYAIKVTAPETTITPSKTLTTAGYLGNINQISGTVKTNSSNTTIYLPIATGSLSSGSGNVQINTANTNVTGTLNNSATGPYNIAIQGFGAVSVTATGMLEAGTTLNSNVATKYYSIPQATFKADGSSIIVNSAGYIAMGQDVGSITAGYLANTPTTGITYSSLTSPALTADNGFLYINPGYYSASRISLGTLIPDSDAPDVVSTALLQGYEAFNTSGQRIIGGILTYSGTSTPATSINQQNGTTFTLSTSGTYVNKDITLTMNVRSASATLAGTASASIGTLNYTYNSTGDNFTVSGSTTITGSTTATVARSGWLQNHLSGSVSGTASVNTTIPKVEINVSLSGATSARKPVINRTTTTITGAKNVGSNDATTTAPTSGYFISVQSAANTATINAIPAVSSAGYGTPTSGQYIAINDSKTVGAAASDITYIPITAGSATINGQISQIPTISICANNGLITASNNATKNLTPTITPGWIESGTQGSVTVSGTTSTQLTTKGGATYYPSTTDQSIASGRWLTGTQTFKAVAIANVTAANIKSGVVATVGDSTSASRVLSITGTFTDANTVSTSQTAATSAQIISGYSAWVNGAEVKGNIASRGAGNIDVSTATATWSAGYYPAGSKAIKQGAVNTPATTIAKAPDITIATATGVITAKYSSSASVTPNVSTAGWISSGTAGTITTTGNQTLTLAQPSISVSGRTITINPGWVRSTTAYSVATTSMSYTNTSVSSNGVVSRGNASWGTGWITGGNVGAATFANIPTTATTYIDISNTNSAPVLTAEGNLYINKGYTDNLIISLAKLIPDTANVNSSSQMLNGVTAFDKNGKLWTGNIQTKTGSDLTASGKTVTVPAGYYAEQYTKDVATGAVITPATTITQAPTISVSSNGYVLASYTKTQNVTPSVTTNGYVTSSQASAGVITTTGSKALELGQSGLSATSVTPGSAQTVYVTPGYRAATATIAVKAMSEGTAATITYSGGGLTSSDKEFTPTVSIGSGSSTNMSNITIGAANTATYAYYFRVYATATSGTMHPTVTRAEYKDTRTAGYLAARAATTILSATTCTATATVKAANAGNATYVSIKAASLNSSGTMATTAVVAIGGTTNMTTSTSAVYYFTRTGSATNGKATVYYSGSAGYLPATTASRDVTVNTAYTGAGTVYIPTAVLGSEGSVSTTPSVTIGGTTNMVTSTSAVYYFTRTGSANAGTVQTKYKATGAGYTPIVAATNGGTVSVTPSFSGNGTVYIPTSAYSISAISGGAVSCSIKTATSCTATTADAYNSGIAIQFTGSRTTATVATTATAGYMPASNKTATLAAGSANSSTYYLQSVKLVAPSSGTRKFDIIVPNGNTTDYITFQFTVDASGNVTVGPP